MAALPNTTNKCLAWVVVLVIVMWVRVQGERIQLVPRMTQEIDAQQIMESIKESTRENSERVNQISDGVN